MRTVDVDIVLAHMFAAGKLNFKSAELKIIVDKLEAAIPEICIMAERQDIEDALARYPDFIQYDKPNDMFWCSKIVNEDYVEKHFNWLIPKECLERFTKICGAFKYLLVKTGSKTWWYEAKGTRLIDPIYGHDISFKVDMEILEETETNNPKELNWEKTTLMPKESVSGWLSPDGRWYPTRDLQHSKIAEYVLNRAEYELESVGWAKVTNKFRVRRLVGDYSADQRNWLSLNGYQFERDRDKAELDATIMM